MENYSKIIDSLSVKFIKARQISVLQSVYVRGFNDVLDNLFFLSKGKCKVEYDTQTLQVNEGDILFYPANTRITISFEKNESDGKSKKISNEEFLDGKNIYFRVDEGNLDENTEISFGLLAFEAKAYESVNFFTSLDIPPFVLNSKLVFFQKFKEILQESKENLIGKSRILLLKTEEIVVGILRYIVSQKLFIEQLTTNTTYFKDQRLISLFSYIKENIGQNLSNKILSNVANVSEEYVGQYFKAMTGINPQDYIEYQRMEAAVHLLKTSQKSIHSISNEVGYKDTAYFCRRFKMMFGMSAGKMRKRQVNVETKS